MSDTKPTQAAKDVIANQDARIQIFERIASFFRRLEEYANVPRTEAMMEIMVKIMVEVLGIFAFVTKEIKQGGTSESIPGHAFPVADRDSEKVIKNFFKALAGKADFKDALSRLDILTKDEVNLATAQTLKLAYDIKGGVKVVSEELKDVDDKVDQLIEGTFSALTSS